MRIKLLAHTERAKDKPLNLLRITKQAIKSVLGYMETQKHPNNEDFYVSRGLSKMMVMCLGQGLD